MPKQTVPIPLVCALAIALLCGGCSQAPSIAILGAFFPGWMVCALLGIVMALLIRSAAGLALPAGRRAPPLLYPVLALLCATLSWIVLFRGAPR